MSKSTLALFVSAAGLVLVRAGGVAPVAAEPPPDEPIAIAAGVVRSAALDIGGRALAPAVRLRQQLTTVFPMEPEPECSILDNFGDSRSGGRTHQGVDIMATLGQDVYAVVDGTLTGQVIDGEAGSSLSGNYWTLTADDEAEYVFMHLSGFAPDLEVGDEVVAGQVIGYVGDTGNPGPGNYHLHFEHHPTGAAAVNPLSFLRPLLPTSCTVI
jgi:murein DD-endopeptidase MepM/ murein hydrolase activator NlpD